MNSQHWLLWDGECGFCGNVISWLKSLDHEQKFHMLPYQECPVPPMTPELGLDASRAIQVVTQDGVQISAGRAVLFILEVLDWHPILARLARKRPFIYLIEAGYWVIARNRNLFGRFLFRSG